VPLKNSVPHFGNQQDLSIIIFIMHMQYTYKYIQMILKSIRCMYFEVVRICFCMLKGSVIKSNPKVRSK
jgi:hypothetical protein